MSTKSPDNPPLPKGTRVHRRSDPGQIGTLTDNTRIKGEYTYYQVDFPNRAEYVPEYELEITHGGHPDPFELIKKRRFGKAEDLRRNLSHIQLSGRLSSMIYSLGITNTEFFAYQFKPVLAFMNSPSRGLLIADEVGLGKTIEAGLIWTELRARYDYRRVLVVCPAMLREKWQDELRERFGIDATIMNDEHLLSDLNRAPEDISDGKGIICSMQGIRPPSTRQQEKNPNSMRAQLAQFLDEQSDSPPIIDLVIIDEAHYLRNPTSQSARLGNMLRDVSKNIVLLSATPINLRSTDLLSLLSTVDQDMFGSPEFFPLVLQANEPLIKARQMILDMNESSDSIRQCLESAARHDVLKDNRQLRHLTQLLAKQKSIDTRSDRVRIAHMIDRVNLLHNVVTRTRKAEVFEWKVVRESRSRFVDIDHNSVERKFYDGVTDAVRDYAKQHNINDGFLLASPQRQVSSCMYAAVKAWRSKAYMADEYLNEEMMHEDIGIGHHSHKKLSPLIQYLASRGLASKTTMQALRVHDSKFEEFIDGIETYFQQYPREKIVVFSYFRATLFYLKERLDNHNIDSIVLTGGMKENKQEVINKFRNAISTNVLLSSEVASEGVDLQFCRILVNYDLPWNPMKIEQRIGRLDRIGQKAKIINILNLCYANTIDQRIYVRLFERIRIFERALGGMEAILGEEIRNLTDFLLRHKLTPQQEMDRISKTATAIETNRQTEERLERESASFIAHGDYIREQVQKAHDLQKRITENDLIIYVRDYLNKHAPGHVFHQPTDSKFLFDIKLPAKMASQFSDYIAQKKLPGSRAGFASGDQVRCEFVNKTNVSTGRIEQINQFHPLVRYISETMDNDDLFPVVAVKLPHEARDIRTPLPEGQYAFCVHKWAFTGLRDEEDIRVRVVHVENRCEPPSAEEAWTLLNAVRLRGSAWPEAKTEAPPDLDSKVFDCHDDLEKEFQAAREAKEVENTDRVNLQIQSSKRHRDRKLDSLNKVLDGHMERGNTGMIPATKGRIEKLQNRFDVQIERFNSQKDITARSSLVCCGVLLLVQKRAKK